MQAKRIIAGQNIDVFARPVMPISSDKTSIAVAFLNKWTAGTPLKVSFKLTDLGLDHPGGYRASDVFTGKDLGFYKPSDSFSGSVNPTGILVVKFTVMTGNKHRYQHQESATGPRSKVNSKTRPNGLTMR